jgi:hypothetical protein
VSFLSKWRLVIGTGMVGVMAAALALPASASELSTDSRTAIPYAVQQIIVIDYRAMQNSPAAMELKAKLLPPELKSLERALAASGLDENHDIEQLCFAAYRISDNDDETKTLGIAQGQFSVPDIIASFNKKKLKPITIRANKIYPMGSSGMMVTFLNPTTMLFGSTEALRPALDARDGLTPNFLTNQNMLAAMQGIDSEPLWSILDQKGTQFMMRGLLGQAAQLADYDSVKKRLLSSNYTMNFNNGVKFALNVVTPDTFTAATIASLLNAAAIYEKLSGSAVEQQAINATSIDSQAGKLEVRFAATDDQFASLIQSSLFQSVVK